MAHTVGGLELRYTARRSWKAEVRCHGKVVVAAAPVTWTNGRYTKSGSEHIFQKVWFQDAQEIERRRTTPKPFIVAVVTAKDYDRFPHEFKDFQAVFEVVATGEVCSDKSIETRVIRRLTSKDFELA